MRTLEVTREFRDRVRKLADEAKMPEVKVRLEKLARQYERHLEKLEAPSIAPR
jgi:hypothetical protein